VTSPSASYQVVVPTRGSVDAVTRVHRNIAAQLPDAEVVLVLNGSGETGRATAEGLGMRVHECAGGGASRARNAGLAVAEGPVLVFLDDDVIVSRDAVAALVAGLHRTGAAVATARVLPADTRAGTFPVYERYLGFDRGATTRFWPPSTDPGRHPVSPFAVWEFGVGAAFAVDVRRLGGRRFDERLSNGRVCGGTEDVDFFYQAHHCGLAITYEATAVVHHLFPTGGREMKAKVRQYALADGAFYAKWIRFATPADLCRDVVGWLRRLRQQAAHAVRGEPAVPVPTLLAEPVYKLMGGLWWVLQGKPSFSLPTRSPARR
jgi:glycosyltransferase involved in cell wall biosynthesis